MVLLSGTEKKTNVCASDKQVDRVYYTLKLTCIYVLQSYMGLFTQSTASAVMMIKYALVQLYQLYIQMQIPT